MRITRTISGLLLAAAMATATRPSLADTPTSPAAPTTATATCPSPAREVPAPEPDGLVIPDAARIALGVAGIGTIIGLVSIPNADTEQQGPTTTITLVSFGVGLAGLATAGIIIWATPRETVAVAASPGAVHIQGSF